MSWECTGTPRRLRATRHVVAPWPSRTGTRVWSRRTCGDTGALPYRVAGPVPRGTWRRQSPPAPGGGSGAAGHVATPLLFPVGWWPMGRVWSHGTRDNTRALPYRVACPVPRGMWRCQSSSTPRTGLEPRGYVVTPEPFLVGCGV
jgi:hypothetical protein